MNILFNIGICLTIAFVTALFVIPYYLKKFDNYTNNVYILEDNKLSPSMLASKFCKTVVYNYVVKSCHKDDKCIRYWVIIRNALKEVPVDNQKDLYTMGEIHAKVLSRFSLSRTIIDIDKVKKILDDMSFEIDEHLRVSSIPTPPYMSIKTYLGWIETSLRSIN